MKRIRGTSARDVLFGTDEDEWIEGRGSNDDIYGGGGNDVIHGGSGRDVLDGGIGDDELWSGWNDRAVDGGSGIDLARADFRGTGQDLLFSVALNLMGSVQVGTTAVRGIERLPHPVRQRRRCLARRRLRGFHLGRRRRRRAVRRGRRRHAARRRRQ